MCWLCDMDRPAPARARDAATAKDDTDRAASPIPGATVAEATWRDPARRRRSVALLAMLLTLVGIFYAVAVVRMGERPGPVSRIGETSR